MPVNLKSAANYSVTSKKTIKNTGSTMLIGNIGVYPGTYPGTTITGFGGITLVGTKNVNNAAAKKVLEDVKECYQSVKDHVVNKEQTGKYLGRGSLTVLTPGIYRFNRSVIADNTITLSGKGIYIFQINGSLTTTSTCFVSLTNGANAQQIFWQVDGVFKLSPGSHIEGNVLCSSNASLGAGSGLHGRVLSFGDNVELNSNVVNNLMVA